MTKKLLLLESVALFVIGLAYWFPSPIRDNWIWIIILILPFIFARLYFFRRICINTNFNDLIAAFFVLCVINIWTAPFETRGVILIFRPLFGGLLFIFCVEYASMYGNIKRLIQTALFGLFIVGILGLIASEWSGKSLQFAGFINLFPRVDSFLWEGGFNPNELAGVISWLLPLAVAMLLYWRPVSKTTVLAGAAFFVSAVVLFLGQSLSGLAGTAIGVFFVMLPHKLRRVFTVGLGVAIIGLQAAILLNPNGIIQLASDIVGRDNTQSLQHRGELWTSAANILKDFPLTGVGVAMYRQPMIREMYPTPNFSMFEAVHPHNELLQIGTDFGLPGMIIFIAWYVTAAGIFLKLEYHEDNKIRAAAIGLAGGLIAHIVYGLGDAIPLWDRFSFVFWAMLGLTAALEVLTRPAEQKAIASTELELDQEGTKIL